MTGSTNQRNVLYLNNGSADPWSDAVGLDISEDEDATIAIAVGDVDGDLSGGWTRYVCPAQRGATLYEAARSDLQDFMVNCAVFTAVDSVCTDAAIPETGTCLHYLMRSLTPNMGDWGADADGAERISICP